MIERRTYKNTKIGIEPDFWSVIETRAKQAGLSWPKYLQTLLESKPTSTPTASYIRCRCLTN